MYNSEIIKLKRSNIVVKDIIKNCFPEYKGRKIKLQTGYLPEELHSYWDEGTKHTFVFYHILTGEKHRVHSNHPFFEANQPRKLEDLKKGLPNASILIEHCIFCGHDCGLTIYAPDKDIFII